MRKSISLTPSIFTHSNIHSIQTTRVGGLSQRPYDSMNMGVFGDDVHAKDNVKQLKNLPHDLFFMNQVHSNKVVELTNRPVKHGQITADACFSRQKNTICAVLSADCLPVLVADTDATVVAAIHCGWKGLYANILEKTIQKMAVDKHKLQFWFGPCISYKPYRVDEAFRLRFVKQNKKLAHCFYLDKNNNWHADLKKIAQTQLNEMGIEKIAQSPYCTYDNKNLFYSYRRDGITGRMTSLIWLS